MRKNTPEVWDNIWENIDSEEEEKLHLEKHRKSIRWKRLKKKILKEFGDFSNVNSIELGAGKGTLSMLFALEGANVTLLDYSDNALKTSKLFFERMNMDANFVKGNILDLSDELKKNYNVSMSMGVAEHFKDDERLKVLKSHFDVLEENGLAIIDVPNKWNIPYVVWKFLSQKLGRWKFGEEYPYTRTEFKKSGEKLGKNFDFIGGYLFEDPFMVIGRLKRLFGIKEKARNQIGTPLDEYFSRTLIAIAKN